jgi:hypothetical protein
MSARGGDREPLSVGDLCRGAAQLDERGLRLDGGLARVRVQLEDGCEELGLDAPR